MEGLKLSEPELRLYGELFGLCDVENSGVVSPIKATELFLSSGLPQEILQQVFELCGATRRGHLGRSQFYIALKLIAAAQCGLPVMIESLNSGHDIPLPKFGIKHDIDGRHGAQMVRPNFNQHITEQEYAHYERSNQALPPHQQQLNQQQLYQLQMQYQQHYIQQQQLYQQRYQQELQQQYQQQYQQQQYQQQQQEYQQQQYQQQQEQYQQQQYQQHLQQQQQQQQQRPVKGAGDAFVEGQLQQMEQQQPLPVKVKPNLQIQTSQAPDGGEVKSPPFSPQEPSPPTSPRDKVGAVNGIGRTAGVATASGGGGGQQGYVQYEGSGVPPPPASQQQPQTQQGPQPQAAAANKIEKGWASFEDESQGLLGGASATAPEENKDWAHFTDSAGSTSNKADTSSISSEAESTDDVWTITDEQREYYVNQFKTMQADVRGVISGAVAKEFFEKSRLPVPELSRIWQLSDVNRDGALSLEEFCTAMHLVVLRRNDIELPDSLPPSLMPYVPFVNPEEPFAADLPPGGTMKRLSTTSDTSQQWGATFPQPESPTSSSVSSPGTKPTPVNFEFKPITADSVRADSQIVHPVALRMSPDGQVTAVDGKTFTDVQDGGELTDGLSSPQQQAPKSTAFTDDLVDLGPPDPCSQPRQMSVGGAAPLHSRPRPTPKKQQSVPATLHDGQGLGGPRLLPPPQEPAGTAMGAAGGERPTTLEVMAGGVTAEGTMPVPPPRTKGHSRHASLDNQLIDFTEGDRPAPTVPPRFSDADLIDLPDNESPTTKGSKERSRSGSRDDLDSSTRATKMPPRHGSLERRDVQALVRKHREKNSILTQLNSELNQELQEVMEQRIALEIQLEHLKPFHS